MRERSREKVNAPRRTTLAGFFVGAAPPSTALNALARAPPPVRARASRSRRRFSPRLCVSRGRVLAVPVHVVSLGSARRRTRLAQAGASARAPERLAVLRGELRRGVAARGTAPAHLEPRANARGVERVRARHHAHVLSSLDVVATHQARRDVASLNKKRPIVVARDTPRKRRDRGVGRRAGRLIVVERRLGRARIEGGIVVRRARRFGGQSRRRQKSRRAKLSRLATVRPRAAPGARARRRGAGACPSARRRLRGRTRRRACRSSSSAPGTPREEG